ncbi:MAG: hypothetical protein RLZZ142_1752 [Verrucomicrobiota bacterium]
MKPSLAFLSLFLPLSLASAAPKKDGGAKPGVEASNPGGMRGWFDWRGPKRDGTTPEKDLPTQIDARKPLWSVEFPGQSTPVVANGRLYINGYIGEGPDLREGVACFDAESGKELWRHLFNDFLSDTIYLRYSTSSPAIDAETGNVYVQGTQGLFTCFSAEGKLLWQHSMMEEFGRLTFPNSRTASPVIDRELVITRGITSNWGAHGPAGDRFYAFDKRTGELVWTSAPGERPQDNTFSHPLLTWMDGVRVLISAGGDSTVVGINARTGDPIFRFPAAKAGAKGGINAALLRHKDALVVIHESENLDTSEVGRAALYRLPVGAKSPEPGKPQVFDPAALEVWRNPLGNLASSPCLVENRLYIVTGTGEVTATDVESGKVLWRKKVAAEQRQSSPFYGDGKLYVAVYIADSNAAGASGAGDTGGNGELFVLKPGAADAEVLSRTVLEGRCYGSPVGYNGKLYLQTDRKLYCFGKAGKNASAREVVFEDAWSGVKPGPAVKLQVIPSEMLLKPGEARPVRVRSIDAKGFTVEESVDVKSVQFESYVPPTALVKAQMKGGFDSAGNLKADSDLVASAGAYQATRGELKGTMRARVLPGLPLSVDFEKFDLSVMSDNPPAPAVPNTKETPAFAFAYPPLAWNGARFRFEVRKAPGEGENKALCKTIDNKLFQRGQIFVGPPGSHNYTIEADVLTEGNKRKMSEVGLVNQRYLIVLKGNAQSLEVSSNQERIRESVPFAWAPNEWYRLKTRVDVAKDGSGVVRAKAWKKGDAEPTGWTIEVPHKTAHSEGAPGLFSFTPQEQRAWIDNVSVTPNQSGLQ